MGGLTWTVAPRTRACATAAPAAPSRRPRTPSMPARPRRPSRYRHAALPAGILSCSPDRAVEASMTPKSRQPARIRPRRSPLVGHRRERPVDDGSESALAFPLSPLSLRGGGTEKVLEVHGRRPPPTRHPCRSSRARRHASRTNEDRLRSCREASASMVASRSRPNLIDRTPSSSRRRSTPIPPLPAVNRDSSGRPTERRPSQSPGSLQPPGRGAAASSRPQASRAAARQSPYRCWSSSTISGTGAAASPASRRDSLACCTSCTSCSSAIAVRSSARALRSSARTSWSSNDSIRLSVRSMPFPFPAHRCAVTACGRGSGVRPPGFEPRAVQCQP
jgi:hypothetical protein